MNVRPGATQLNQTESDERMSPALTAVVLVGIQNEYFAPHGNLRGDIDSGEAADQVLAATVALVDRLAGTAVLLVATPIVFTPTYEELVDPVGLLAAIKTKSAFQQGTEGARPAAELGRFAARIVEVAGRRGLNAFSGTGLDDLLAGRGIVDVVLAGALACVNVDSTARSAHQLGYRVTVLSDCTLSRTRSEHDLFCRRIFPLYAEVVTSTQLLDRLGLVAAGRR